MVGDLDDITESFRFVRVVTDPGQAGAAIVAALNEAAGKTVAIHERPASEAAAWRKAERSAERRQRMLRSECWPFPDYR